MVAADAVLVAGEGDAVIRIVLCGSLSGRAVRQPYGFVYSGELFMEEVSDDRRYRAPQSKVVFHFSSMVSVSSIAGIS